MTFPLSISTSGDDKGFHELGQKLIGYNSAHIAPMRIVPLLVSFRDKDGELLGGLAGKMFYDWLSIDLLWVHEALRGKGYGTALLAQGESEARARGCKRAWLDTIGEAAMPFYMKNGYATWGALPDYPPGFTRVFLLKAL